jgi:hypothetical protein
MCFLDESFQCRSIPEKVLHFPSGGLWAVSIGNVENIISGDSSSTPSETPFESIEGEKCPKDLQ